MNQTTGKQYMLSALRRKPMDRVPTTVLIGPYCSRLTRYSVRGFLPTPVPDEAIDKILRAVAASPSFTNTQPWKAAVVTGRSRD